MAPERKELFDKGALPLHGDTRLLGLLSCSVSVIFSLGSQWNTSFLHFLLLLTLLAALHSMQDPQPETRDQTCALCSGSVVS